MDYFEVIEKRHSVRAYKPDAVEQDKLDRILQAAVLAPTACNLQPFRIFVLKTEGRAEELKTIYKNEWFSRAPYVLGICTIPGKAWKRRDQKNYADVDASIVMDHIILAATALGLGTCWIGAFDPQAARKVLKLDDSMEPIAFTPLGYADDSGFQKNRQPLSELVIYQ